MAYRVRVWDQQKGPYVRDGNVVISEHLLDCVNRKRAVHPSQANHDFNPNYPSSRWLWHNEEFENATTFKLVCDETF
jgi:hypothetical protein